MKKTEARSIFKQQRSELSEQQMEKLNDLMLIRFQICDLPFIDCLFSYWPIRENNEPATHLFTEFLRFRNPGMQVLYPKSDFNKNTMHAVVTDIDTPFEKHEYNIYEPDSDQIADPTLIDLVFVPLIICDHRGYRVGFGKGFYDRYLAQCRSDCIKIGFSFFEPLPVLEDANEFDIPLDLCITPQNMYVF